MQKEAIRDSESYPHLPIPLGSELLTEISRLNLRIKISLVGMEKGNFILAKVYPNDLIGTFRSESIRESAINLSYMHGDTVYGFQSEVLNVVTTPAKMFFFSYPRIIKEVSVRQNSRYNCILPAVTMFGHEIVEMVITDISREGCQSVIRVSERNEALYKLIQIDRKVDMKVHFPGADAKSALTGKIRTVTKDIDKITVGMMFEEMPPEVKSAFNRFISLISEYKN